MAEELVNIDALTDKQRSREYKTTAKDIKSKDLDTRIRALNKLADERYFTDGRCLQAVLESIIVNKKSIDLSNASVVRLLKFTETTSPETLFTAFSQILTDLGNLNLFQCIVDLTSFKEEVKKPKKNAQLSEVDPPIENPMFGHLRCASMKILYLISKIDNVKHDLFEKFWTAWVKIPNVYSNVLNVLAEVQGEIKSVDKNRRYEFLERGIWSLVTIERILRSDDDNSVKDFITNGDFLTLLNNMSLEPVLSIHCMKIYYILISSNKHLELLSNSCIPTGILSIMKLSSSVVTDYHEKRLAAANIKTKEKAPKKESKPVAGKKSEVVQENREEKLLLAEPHILALAYLKLGSVIVTSATESFPTVFDENTYLDYAQSVKVLLDMNSSWIVSGIECNSQSIFVINDSVTAAVHLIGAVGNVSNSIRLRMCQSGLFLSVFELLKSSSEVIKLSQPTANENTLKRFRYVLEKTITILSSKNDSDLMVTDENSFIGLKLSSLIDLFQPNIHIQDADLTRRGIRIFHNIIRNSSDSVAFLQSFGFDLGTLTTLLSSVFEVTSLEFIDDLKSRVIASKNEISVVESKVEEPLMKEFQEQPQELILIAEAGIENTASKDEVVLKLCPTAAETVFDTVAIIKHCLGISHEFVIQFISNGEVSNRVNTISQLLQLCGPCCVRPAEEEYKISRFDARKIDWLVESITALESSITTINLRPLLFAFVSDMVKGCLPNSPLVPLSPGKVPSALATTGSPFEDSAIATCLECFHACCSTLLVGCHLQSNHIGQVVLASGNEKYPLQYDVLDAALGFLKVVGQMGTVGVVSAIESIASGFTGTKKNEKLVVDGQDYSCISFFNACLKNISENESFSGSTEFIWSRPKTFNQVYVSDDAAPSQLPTLCENKLSWPFIVIAFVLGSKISDTRLPLTSINSALQSLLLFTRSSEFEKTNQPVMFDLLAAAFLSIGGGVALTGLFGRFGLMPSDSSERYDAVTCLRYLFERGHCRDAAWRQWSKEREVVEPIGKSKAATTNKKKDKTSLVATIAAGNQTPAGKKEKNSASNKKGVVVPTLFVTPPLDDIVLNVEPDNEVHVDPNQGPTPKLWTLLLNCVACDPFTHATGTTMIHVMIQSILPVKLDPSPTNNNDEDNLHNIPDNTNPNIDSNMNNNDIELLLNLGVDVNIVDLPNGMTPLMYALIFGNELLVSQLTQYQSPEVDNPRVIANLDHIDAFGNPLIKYAFLTLDSDQQKELFRAGHLDSNFSMNVQDCIGNRSLLKYFSSSPVDVNIPDEVNGNYPLHYALGQCAHNLTVGGYNLNLRGGDYWPCMTNNDSQLSSVDEESMLSSLVLLESLGADANVVNKETIAPLHLAAAKGSLKVIQYLIGKMKAHPNTISSTWGYLPLHVLGLCCPPSAISCFEFFTSVSNNLPIETIVFSNTRKQYTREAKYLSDMNSITDNSIDDVVDPTVLGKPRQSISNLLLSRTWNQENILHLCMAGHYFEQSSCLPINSKDISSKKEDRMAFSLHLIQYAKSKGVLLDLLQSVDSENTSILHASTLLLTGITPKSQTLTAKELRSKRIRKYESIEKQILDIMYSTLISSSVFQFRDSLQILCQRTVKGSHYLPFTLSEPTSSGWTILHGAISSNNHEYASYLLDDLHYPLFTHSYMHYMAGHVNCTKSIVKTLIRAYTSSGSSHAVIAMNGIDLDTNSRPIHLMIKYKNKIALKEALKTRLVNINLRDDADGYSGFHYACVLGDISIVDMFECCIDRADLSIESNEGRTVIDDVIRMNRIDILERIIKWRRNDVVSGILRKRGNRVNSLLYDLEDENTNLVDILRYRFPDKILGKCEYNGTGIRTELASNSVDDTIGNEPVTPMSARPYDNNLGIRDEVDVVSEAFQAIRLEESNRVDQTQSENTKPDVTPLTPAPQYSDSEYQELLKRYLNNSKTLGLLLPLVLSMKDAIGNVNHAKACFETGQMYQEFISNNLSPRQAEAMVEYYI